MKDINNKSDIVAVVDSFYERVREDDLLSPVFRLRIAGNDWPRHLQLMYSFWNTILFAHADYRGNPFPKHICLGIETIHFDRWVKLFHDTIDKQFSGARADEMKDRAVKMRRHFESRLAGIAGDGMPH